MDFAKMQAIGNDFVIVDARGLERDWPGLAVAMCDRHFGVGADGLVLIVPSEKADLRMRMFNPDGSEAEMCGNGMCCFAKYALDHGIVPRNGLELGVETMAGILRLGLQLKDDEVTAVQVAMGRPKFSPAEIPVNPELAEAQGLTAPIVDYPLHVDGRYIRVTCVSMGNPHAVAFIEEPIARFPLRELGPLVERHPFFPRRVNFEIVNREGPDRLWMRVWERGAGETLACGTCACAVTVVGRLKGLVGDQAQVVLPGGELTIAWDGQGEVLMTGPAAYVFSGTWPEVMRDS